MLACKHGASGSIAMPGARSDTHCEVDGREVRAGHAPLQLLHGGIAVAHGQKHLEADECRIDDSRLALLRDVDIVQRPGNMMSIVNRLIYMCRIEDNREACKITHTWDDSPCQDGTAIAGALSAPCPYLWPRKAGPRHTCWPPRYMPSPAHAVLADYSHVSVSRGGTTIELYLEMLRAAVPQKCKDALLYLCTGLRLHMAVHAVRLCACAEACAWIIGCIEVLGESDYAYCVEQREHSLLSHHP